MTWWPMSVLPNAWRSRAYVTDSRYASSAIATHCPARKSRSVAKFIMIARKPGVLVADEVRDRARGSPRTRAPRCRSPTSRSSSSFLLTVKPGVPRSMTSSETPPWPSPPVRTAVVTKSARQPDVMNVFAPLTT